MEGRALPPNIHRTTYRYRPGPPPVRHIARTGPALGPAGGRRTGRRRARTHCALSGADGTGNQHRLLDGVSQWATCTTCIRMKRTQSGTRVVTDERFTPHANQPDDIPHAEAGYTLYQAHKMPRTYKAELHPLIPDVRLAREQ